MTGEFCVFLVSARYPHSEHASKESDYKNDGQAIVLEDFFHLNSPDEFGRYVSYDKPAAMWFRDERFGNLPIFCTWVIG
ncbi:hypothetical protein ABIC60_004095 [Phyllobacterium ifriqiyense]